MKDRELLNQISEMTTDYRVPIKEQFFDTLKNYSLDDRLTEQEEEIVKSIDESIDEEKENRNKRMRQFTMN